MLHTNKEAFLVTGYTPTIEKEEILISLLKKLKQKNTPIFLVLHNIPSKITLDLVDYFLYDPYNPILTTYKDTHGYNFGESHHTNKLQYNFVTQYNLGSTSNHGLAALRMIWLGLYNLKGLGFKKCHSIEYDTGVSSFKEITNNFNLLDTWDCISYNGFDDMSRKELIYPQFTAYNLESYSYKELEMSPENDRKIRDEFLNEEGAKFNGMAEAYYFNLLHKQKNHFQKNYKLLEFNTIIDISNTILKTNINNVHNSIEFIPLHHQKTETFYILLKNKSKEIKDFQIIINNKELVNRRLKNNEEFLYNTNKKTDQIEVIKGIVDDKVFTLDLHRDINIERFKQTSFIKFNGEN